MDRLTSGMAILEKLQAIGSCSQTPKREILQLLAENKSGLTKKQLKEKLVSQYGIKLTAKQFQSELDYRESGIIAFSNGQIFSYWIKYNDEKEYFLDWIKEIKPQELE